MATTTDTITVTFTDSSGEVLGEMTFDVTATSTVSVDVSGSGN